jgi:hypothetical protein
MRAAFDRLRALTFDRRIAGGHQRQMLRRLGDLTDDLLDRHPVAQLRGIVPAVRPWAVQKLAIETT